MKNLILGIVEFRKKLTPEHRELFANLALGQRPNALFIACSDSRVVPNLFASTNPGDLFVLRNIGNLIPNCNCPEESSVQAALAYSVFTLKIRDIIVCGHSECGAMQVLSDGIETISCPYLGCWLKHGLDALEKYNQGLILDSSLSRHNQISQINVLQQLEHIASYPFIQEKIEKKELRLHGWWFDIARADVYCYEPLYQKFSLIDEEEAKLILQRLG